MPIGRLAIGRARGAAKPGRLCLRSSPAIRACRLRIEETSWILGTLPLRWADRAEVHDHAEEMYLLSGENHGDRGVMRPGAYFWRPGHIAHGPYGTLTGNLYFFRSKGGPLITRYVAPDKPFRWNPPYDPGLPDELRALAREAPAGPVCW
jgi:hypothetical protein